MSNCRVCGGRGVVECADIYKNPHGDPIVLWELSSVIRCFCWYLEEEAS